MKAILVIPHYGSWFLTQTCLAQLEKYPPILHGKLAQIVVTDNSWWSDSIYGIRRTWNGFWLLQNTFPIHTHGNAIDIEMIKSCYLKHHDFDFLVTMETDVLVLREGWLDAIAKDMKETDYAIGAWHHQNFIGPSLAVYNGKAVRDAQAICQANKSKEMRWGEHFEKTAMLSREEADGMTAFSERRGWPEGTVLKEKPHAQNYSPGYYEPGQWLHHQCVQEGWTYTKFPTETRRTDIPVGTFYLSGEPGKPMDRCYGVDNPPNDRSWAVHLWGGSRGLGILQFPPDHPANTDPTNYLNRGFWLTREALYWRDLVPPDIQKQTLELIRKYGWSKNPLPNYAESVATITKFYRDGGIEL